MLQKGKTERKVYEEEQEHKVKRAKPQLVDKGDIDLENPQIPDYV